MKTAGLIMLYVFSCLFFFIAFCVTFSGFLGWTGDADSSFAPGVVRMSATLSFVLTTGFFWGMRRLGPLN